VAKQFKFDETKFKQGQREAAIAMVEYEFTPKGERKTKQQIADELGITRKTLHNWNTGDPNFIAYKNHLAGQFADTNLAFVYNKLVESIGNGSVRAMEVFLKRIGDMDTSSELTIKSGDGDGQSFEERKAALMERIKASKSEE
jgi:predicted transcriptional regulator